MFVHFMTHFISYYNVYEILFVILYTCTERCKYLNGKIQIHASITLSIDNYSFGDSVGVQYPAFSHEFMSYNLLFVLLNSYGNRN